MAEVIHRYVGRGEKFVPAPARQQSKSELEREELDAEWRRKRISAGDAKQRLHEAKLLEMKRELISRAHVQKQAALLVLSPRARLLAIPAALTPRIVQACGVGCDPRAIESLIDGEVREVLEEIASMPERVSDPEWMRKLDDESSVKKPPSKSKGSS